MQVRTVRFESKDPVVVGVILALICAALFVFLSAALAVAAGVAVLGGVGFVARRLLGGRHLVQGVTGGSTRDPRPGNEVFPVDQARLLRGTHEAGQAGTDDDAL